MGTVYSESYWTGSYTYTRVKVEYSGTSATATLLHSRINNWTGSEGASNKGQLVCGGATSGNMTCYVGQLGEHYDYPVVSVSFSIPLSGGTYSCYTKNTTGGPFTYKSASSPGYITIPAQTIWNDINAYQPDGSTQNGLIFDLTTSDGGSWTNLTNEPSNFSKSPGTSATISNIRSNVAGAHYSGNNVTNNTAASFTWTMNTADWVCKLYSAWDTYAVTYNANGGMGAPAQQTKTYGQNLTLSSTIPTMSSTLQQGYTVYFNANGGSCPVSSYTTTDYLMHSFEEWNTAQDGSGTTYYPSGTYTQNAILKLYAQWNSHTERGGVSLPTPTKTGCTFLGWSRSLIDIEYVEDGYIPDDNDILYAIYEQSEKLYTTSTLLDGLVIQNVQISNLTPFSFDVSAAATLPIVRDITYSFSNDDGSTWTPYQASATYSFTNLTEETSYLVMVRAKAIHQGIDAQDDIAYTDSAISVITPADQAKIRIKVSGTWLKGKAYIRVNGEWKKAKKVYIKKDGQWIINKND